MRQPPEGFIELDQPTLRRGDVVLIGQGTRWSRIVNVGAHVTLDGPGVPPVRLALEDVMRHRVARRTKRKGPSRSTPRDQRDAEYVKLGDVLRAARKRSGLTLEQLGQQVGLAKGNVARIEGGLRPPSLRTLRKLCDALRLDAGVVLRAVFL